MQLIIVDYIINHKKNLYQLNSALKVTFLVTSQHNYRSINPCALALSKALQPLPQTGNNQQSCSGSIRIPNSMYTSAQLAIHRAHHIDLLTQARAYFLFMKIYVQIILAETAYAQGYLLKIQIRSQFLMCHVRECKTSQEIISNSVTLKAAPQ